jgi:hypothetical protein
VEGAGRRQTQISHGNDKCGVSESRVLVMEVVNELDELEGASVPSPYVSGAGEGRRKSCQEVVDAKGVAELVSL